MAQKVGAEEGVTRAVRLIEGIPGAWNGSTEFARTIG